MVILVLGRFGASTTVVQGFISITAPPVDSLRLISGGLRCSDIALTSICGPRSSSQLRVTSVSTFDRARCEAPSPAHGFDHCFSAFQLAGALSTGQYKRAVSKQRKRPQTVNRLEGVICPCGVEHEGNGCSGLWTRHYRQLLFCNSPLLYVFFIRGGSLAPPVYFPACQTVKFCGFGHVAQK